MFSRQRDLPILLSTLMVLMVLMLNSGPAAAGTTVGPTLQLGKALSGPAGPTQYCRQPTRFDQSNFSDPTNVDNQWTPFVPGTRVVLRGYTTSDGRRLPHRVEFIVTDLTKVIDGVQTVVSWDRDYEENRLVESELIFHAQDDAGYVWNLGEYPEEYENGQLVGAPSTWITGIDRAKAGALMLPEPQVDGSNYLQGFSPTIDFLDCATVTATDEPVCIRNDCYDNVLVTDESSPLDPDSGVQRKFYASGLGVIQVTAVGDPEGETMLLDSISHLGPGAMAQIHRQALELDQRGYEISDVYRQTEPAR